MALKKAVKTESKLRMAILGPAGSGKTYTALKLATVLAKGRPIALYDTEHGSAAKYARDRAGNGFDFDTDNIAAPFHPDKFCEAIREAAAGGYGVVIIDSLSHAWSGEGGLLDLVEQFARRMKSPNSFAAWKDATPIQNRLTEAIVGAPIHIIVTMRSKTEYILADNGRGQQVPRKVGMAPIQRDQFEYEFDVVMEMDAENNGVITKTRCSALTGGVFSKPGDNVASVLNSWLSDGAPAPEPPAETTQQSNGATHRKLGQVTDEQIAGIDALGLALYATQDAWTAKRPTLVRWASTNKTSMIAELLQADAAALIAKLEEKIRTEYETLAQPFVDAGKPNVLINTDRVSGVELANALKALRKEPVPVGVAKIDNLFEHEAEPA